MVPNLVIGGNLTLHISSINVFINLHAWDSFLLIMNLKVPVLKVIKEFYALIAKLDTQDLETLNVQNVPIQSINFIRLLLVFIIALVVIVFVIRSTFKGAIEKKNVTSIYFKIMMNHLQLLLLTASFNF